MLPSGVWRLAWLKTLNTSQLNSRLNLSVSLKFLCKPQSASNSPGPRSEFLVVFPKVNGAGVEYAPGLNQQLTECVDRPFEQDPENALPVRSGRRVMSKVFKLVLFSVTVKGRPLWARVTPVHCQPPNTALTQPLVFEPQCSPFPKGSVTVCPSEKTLARSNTAGP